MGLKELRDVKLQIKELVKTHLNCKQAHNTEATCPTGQSLHHQGVKTKQCIPDEGTGNEYY